MKKIYCYFLGIMLTAGFFCYRYSKITETSETSDPKQKAPPGGDGGACRNWLKVLSLHVDGAMPHAAGGADSGQCCCQD